MPKYYEISEAAAKRAKDMNWKCQEMCSRETPKI